MEALWFAIAAVMVAVYVVLDGFDFGAGALHLLSRAPTRERRQVLAAIGPFWDGNEVWLLAARRRAVPRLPEGARRRASRASTSRSCSCCGC